MANTQNQPVPVAINDIALRDLSHKIGGEWEALATYLGNTTSRIYCLKQDHLYSEDQIFNMLVSWRHNQRSEHIKHLTSALHRVGRVDLAQGFESPMNDVILRALSTRLGYEWEQLATHLGCSRAEIDKSKLDHPKVDNQIFNLFVSWRQRQSAETDVKQTFATALRNSGRKNLAELLTRCSSEAWTQPFVFDLNACRRDLQQFYEDEKADIPLIPYDFEGGKPIEDIFVELELEENSKEMTKTKLRSYNALVDLKQVSKKKVLVRGGPGSGKTTLVSKLAHDWSVNIDPETGENIEDKELSKFSLLLTLNMRELKGGMSLAEAVKDQLLPDSVISQEGLEAYIQDHQDEVLIILDGYDEYPFSLSGDTGSSSGSSKRSKCDKGEIMEVLCASRLVNTCLIVTSRPHRVSEFGKTSKKYANVALTGFAKENIKKYVYKFFEMSEDYNVSAEEQQNRANVDKLITEIEGNSALNALAKTPVILALLCLLWRDSQELPKRVTQLYEEAMHYLVRRWHERENDEEPDESEVRAKSEELMMSLGKVALDGIFEDKLIFEAKDFDDKHLEKACKAGLLSKERKRSKLQMKQEVSFVHKTFQEMCGGKYLADLISKDTEAFNAYLQRISEVNVGNLEYMLRFCCGLSKAAAIAIIPVAVELSRQLMVKVGDDCRLAYDDVKQDPWRLSLLLLFESQCPEDYHLLKPLFNQSKLRIRFHNAEVIVAAQFFFDILENLCKKANNKPSMLDEILETELVGVRAQDVNVASKLIRNMQRVKELKLVFLSRSEYAEMEQLGDSISQLPDLSTLILEGRDCDTSGIIGKLAKNRKSSKSMQEFACHLSNFSIDALTIFVSRQPSLVRLKLLDNRMTEGDIGKLLDGIQEAKLEVLEIFWNQVGKSSKYIRPFLPTLQSLYLSNTKMNPDDWREVFCDMSKAVHMEKLDLTWNKIGSSVMMLAETGTALSKLRILILRKGYFKLGRDDMDTIGQWLGNLVNLENLDLSDNDISEASDEFPDQLAKLTNLTRLNLSATRLRKSTFKKMESAIKSMPNLKQLHLAENDVEEAIVDIADGLKGLSELTWLNLEECGMDSDGVAALTHAFDGLTNLTNMYLHGNSQITPSGVQVLFDNLHRLPKLECLEMRGLEIDYESCSLMVKECFDDLKWRPFQYDGCKKVVLDKVSSEDVKKIASIAAK